MFGLLYGQTKKALGIVDADADTKAKSARTAMLFLELILYYQFLAICNGFCSKYLGIKEN